MNNIAPTDQIKTFVPLPQAIETYTGEQFKKNKMRCPLHNEKTASFTVYPENNTFYCFGCGAHGTLIDFVMLYFNLNFKEAVYKITCDFRLSTPLTVEELSSRNRVINKLNTERSRKREQERQSRVKYWELFDKVIEYKRYLKIYRPLSASEKPHPLFIKALQNIEYTKYLLNCAENERMILNE